MFYLEKNDYVALTNFDADITYRILLVAIHAIFFKIHSDEGLQSETSVQKNHFHYGVLFILF